MKKRLKKLLIILGALACAIALAFGGLLVWQHRTGYGLGYELSYFIKQKLFTKPMDILYDGPGFHFGGNPWYNAMPRPKNWRQIVQDSRFALGEPQLTAYDYDTWTYWELALPGATFPNIDGSTVMLPMAVEFARQHLGMTPEQAGDFYNFSKTHFAYDYLCNRVEQSYYFREYFEGVDFAIWETGRPVDLVLGTAPGQEEFAIAGATGVTFAQRPVCCDAFVFITGKNNPVDSLTLDQLRGIFSGEITNWKQVGGRDEAVRAYQREPGSGSQTGIEQLVMQGLPMADPKTVTVIASMGELVDAVAEYRNSASSIGYSYRYYIDNQYSKENIKQLKIEGVAPTDDNIRSGAYPLSVNYVGVIRAGEEDGPGGLFLDWILSAEGQACVAQAGYIPLG